MIFVTHRRSLGALATIGAAALILTGCSGSPASTGAADDSISIIYSVDKIDENQNRYISYMQDHVDALNEAGANITFESYDANGSVDKQISDVQTALIKQPDVLIFSAVDSVGSLPAVQAAKDAGVKTVDFRPSDPEPDVYDVAFGASETDYAAATTDWMQSLLDADPELKLNIGLIYGAAAQTAQLEREDAVKAFAETQPDRVKIVGEQYGNWQTDIAQNTTSDWLQSQPEINLVSSANDAMALGASNALTAAGVRDKVLVSSYDINPSVLDNVKNGTIDFTTGVLAPDYGQIIDVSVGLVDGSFTDRTYSVEPIYSVTSENVDDVISKLNG
jgi:ribose transport system substrate-binding protein